MNLKIESDILQALKGGPSDVLGLCRETGHGRTAITAACRSLSLKKKVSKNDTGWFFIIK